MAGWPLRIPTLAELEKLPLLSAIIKETLRYRMQTKTSAQSTTDGYSLAYGVMHRLPRISPDVPIQYRQYIIPPGVPVGMSTYFMHTDPKAFPNPFAFKPERWLGEITPTMTRNFVPFSRGSRNCLGQQ
jgi:cytochrome P450